MTLSSLIVTLAQFLSVAIILRAVLSWFPISRALQPVAVVLDIITDPVLTPIRRRLPAVGGFDLSPILALLLITVVESLSLSLLAGH
jgi:YggT family protein